MTRSRPFRSLASLALEKAPLLLLAAASSVVTFRAQHAWRATAPIDLYPLGSRVSNAIVSTVLYLRDALRPIRPVLVIGGYRLDVVTLPLGLGPDPAPHVDRELGLLRALG
jgi:hypothetical protein